MLAATKRPAARKNAQHAFPLLVFRDNMLGP